MATIKEILKPNNTANDIVLHVGANKTTTPENAYSDLQFQAGFYWPIVKVRSTTFTKPAIKTFELNFGYQLLPTLEFMVVDDSRSFQQSDYPVKNDVVTVFLGNNYDTSSKPIQLDFLIDDVTTLNSMDGSGSAKHSFTCTLAIEHAFENINFAGEQTSLNVLYELCKAMNLGLVTNLDSTNDRYKYRQYSKTNIEYLKDVCSKVYVDDATIIHYYIDQYFRLNVIDINAILSAPAPRLPVRRDVTFFKTLANPEELVLNNAQYNLTNVQFKFGSYTTSSNAFETYKEVKPVESTVINKDYSQAIVKSTVKDTRVKANATTGGATKSENVTENNVTNSKRIQTIAIDGEHNSNVQQLGSNANKSRFRYLTNNSITLRLNNPSNLLNINQMVPVELYKPDQFSQTPLKNSDTNLDSTQRPITPDGTEAINPTLSGDYAITGMTFAYRQNQNLWQELKLIRREWKPQHYDVDKSRKIDLSEATFGAPKPYTYPPPPPPPAVDNSGYGGQYGGSLGNWMQIARGELGTAEVAGAGSNPRIDEYHRVGGGLSGGQANDATAWCGSFVGWCMVKAGYPKPNGSAAAISWANYGIPCAPGTVGAIIVLKLKPSSMTYSGNHVGFCAGLNGDKVSILGGNQGNSVSQLNMASAKVIAWRLPPGSPSQGIANAGNSVAPTGPLRISNQGVEFIKSKEGCKLTAYWDSYGKVWTVGYGNTKQAKPGMTITYQQAEQLLRQDIVYFENYINQNVKVKLTQAMFDALVCLTFNTGPGKVSPSSAIGIALKNRQYQTAADTFLRYNTSKGKYLQGLATRRQQERQMFMSQGVNPI
ncbi:lysozyme [Chryseobacterium phage MA9V-2]|nr:lysozyme [Chryseobacterium phage MA9V-2]